MMKVTILTVVRNGERTISRTIESVLHQTYPELEYIILDGASQDKTVEIAQSYIHVFQEKGYEYRIISEKDKGMYDALNKGALLATGELVGQINSDDWYENTAVENMVHLYESDPYDVAWGDIRIIKRSGNIIKKAHIGKLWTSLGFCHPGMFTKRTVLLEYPYALETMYDDFEFVTRIHKAGKKITTVHTLVSNFTFGGMSTKKSIAEVNMRIRVKWSIYHKYKMSHLYWFYCVAMEYLKYILG